MLSPYRALLRRPGMLRLVATGWLARIPFFGSGVVVTLHVVGTLERTYAEAGLIVAALLVGVGVGGPYRGRLLDRVGLRRVAVPCLLVQTAYAVIGPLAGFTLLLLFSLLSGLFMIPVMSVMRQAMMAAVSADDRRVALSLDGMVVELSAMFAPALGVWAALTLTTRWAIVALTVLGVVAGLVLAVLDPPLRSTATAGSHEPVTTRSWFGAGVVVALVAGVTSTVMFTGTDLAVVARANEAGLPGSIGWVMALWAAGSLIGGLLYGAWKHPVNAYVILAGLSLLTALPALAPSMVWLGAVILVTGLLGQPAVTSVVELLTDQAPEAARGEVMGWHSTAMTGGSALGAPLAGAAIDAGGGRAGFLITAALGLVVALVALAFPGTRAQRARA